MKIEVKGHMAWIRTRHTSARKSKSESYNVFVPISPTMRRYVQAATRVTGRGKGC